MITESEKTAVKEATKTFLASVTLAIVMTGMAVKVALVYHDMSNELLLSKKEREFLQSQVQSLNIKIARRCARDD